MRKVKSLLSLTGNRAFQWFCHIFLLNFQGVVLIPGTVMLREGDIKHRLEASGAKCIIVNEEVSHLVDKVRTTVNPCLPVLPQKGLCFW